MSSVNLSTTLSSKLISLYTVHRCTRVENPGKGVPDVFAKIPRGGSRLSGKNCLGRDPISGFITFVLTSVLKFA